MIKENLRLLTASIPAIQTAGDGHRIALMIPGGVTLELISGSTADGRMVDVEWEGRTASVFAEDLFQRSKPVNFMSV